MLTDLEKYFLLFVAYSIIGWCMETIIKSVKAGHFVHRGFLIGPYLPIYGTGVLLATVLLDPFMDNLPLLFGFSILVCGTLEYLTSFILEKIFHARWWDYSQRPLNLNGRICAETLLIFGVVCTFVITCINPIFFDLFDAFPPALLHALSIIFAIVLATDAIISITVLIEVRKVGKTLDYDASEELAHEVRQTLMKRGWHFRRLLSAYPHMRHITKPRKTPKSHKR